MAMIGRVISRGVSASARRGAAALDWSRRSFSSSAGSGDDESPPRIPQHFGPGKLIGKTALITGLCVDCS